MSRANGGPDMSHATFIHAPLAYPTDEGQT